MEFTLFATTLRTHENNSVFDCALESAVRDSSAAPSCNYLISNPSVAVWAWNVC